MSLANNHPSPSASQSQEQANGRGRQPMLSADPNARFIQESLLDKQKNTRMNTFEQAKLDAIARLAVSDQPFAKAAQRSQVSTLVRKPEFSENMEARLVQESMLAKQKNTRMNTFEQAKLDAMARLAVADGRNANNAKVQQLKALDTMQYMKEKRLQQQQQQQQIQTLTANTNTNNTTPGDIIGGVGGGSSSTAYKDRETPGNDSGSGGGTTAGADGFGDWFGSNPVTYDMNAAAAPAARETPGGGTQYSVVVVDKDDSRFENVKFVDTLKNKKKQQQQQNNTIDYLLGDHNHNGNGNMLFSAGGTKISVREYKQQMEIEYDIRLHNMQKKYESKIESLKSKIESNRVLNRAKDKTIAQLKRNEMKRNRAIEELKDSKVVLVQATANAIEELRHKIRTYHYGEWEQI